MIPLLIELRLAQNTHVNLSSDLIGVRCFVLAVPPPDRLDVSPEVIEELLSSRGNMSTKLPLIVPSAEQDQVVELQERFESFVAEQVEVMIYDCVEIFVGREHVLSDTITEVIPAAFEYCVDCREVTLDIAQLIINPSNV